EPLGPLVPGPCHWRSLLSPVWRVREKQWGSLGVGLLADSKRVALSPPPSSVLVLLSLPFLASARSAYCPDTVAPPLRTYLVRALGFSIFGQYCRVVRCPRHWGEELGVRLTSLWPPSLWWRDR